MNNFLEDLSNVPHPICPLNMYFEGDEDKCDTSKCDFDTERGGCTEACKKIKPFPAIGTPEDQEREALNQDRAPREERLLDDDKALLPGGGISWHQFKEPDCRILKTFDNLKKDISYTIDISTTELTALCPLTGFPDFYKLVISYTPDEKCIESKSAKFYFHSFRSYGGFIETLANKIADDWVKICNPKWVKVDLTMNPRGGIPITVVVERDKRK